MNFVLQPWQLLIVIRAVDIPQVGGRTIATPASRRQARVHGKAWRHSGHRELLRLARNYASPTPIWQPLWKASSDSASVAETPGLDERFGRRIRPADDVFGTHRGRRRAWAGLHVG